MTEGEGIAEDTQPIHRTHDDGLIKGPSRGPRLGSSEVVLRSHSQDKGQLEDQPQIEEPLTASSLAM